MTLKDKFKRWVEKKDKQQREQDEIRMRYSRNRRYHRYFQGYTEYTETRPNGKKHITRVYTGPYFKAELTNAAYAAVRVLYIFLWIAAAYCLVSATIAYYGYNYTWYATVFEALSYAGCFIVMTRVFSAALADRKMKIRNYQSLQKTFPIFMITAAAAYILAALGMFLYMIINHSSEAGVAVPPIKMLAGAVCYVIIFLIERSISYEILENPVKPGPGGVEISYN